MTCPFSYVRKGKRCSLEVNVSKLIYTHFTQGYWPYVLNDGGYNGKNILRNS